MKKQIEAGFAEELFSLYKNVLNELRCIKQTKKQSNISHQCIIPFSTYSPWNDDVEFIKIYDQIKANTLVDIYRCYELWNHVKRNSFVKGIILEIGVWRGGTGAILAAANKANNNSKIILADTFEGVVKASNKDSLYKGGEHADTNEKIVNDLMLRLGLTNYTLLKGVFPDKVNLDSDKNVKIKFCHIDVDTYESAKDIFDYIWPKMVKGGTVIFDDYGFWGCEGVTNLCNELRFQDSIFIHNINGHGIFIKL